MLPSDRLADYSWFPVLQDAEFNRDNRLLASYLVHIIKFYILQGYFLKCQTILLKTVKGFILGTEFSHKCSRKLTNTKRAILFYSQTIKYNFAVSVQVKVVYVVYLQPVAIALEPPCCRWHRLRASVIFGELICTLCGKEIAIDCNLASSQWPHIDSAC